MSLSGFNIIGVTLQGAESWIQAVQGRDVTGTAVKGATRWAGNEDRQSIKKCNTYLD